MLFHSLIGREVKIQKSKTESILIKKTTTNAPDIFSPSYSDMLDIIINNKKEEGYIFLDVEYFIWLKEPLKPNPKYGFDKENFKKKLEKQIPLQELKNIALNEISKDESIFFKEFIVENYKIYKQD